MWQRRAGGRPLIIGHRGASAVETENTAVSFARARADGADGVELDVILCATGEVVVFHDDDLRRLVGRPERIADLPWTELQAVRLPGDTRIPTLDEALDACGPDLLVNVELKADGLPRGGRAALVDAVAGVVGRRRVGHRVLVSSFSPAAIYAWMRRAAEVRAALLFEHDAPLPLRNAWLAPWLRPFALHPELSLCRPKRVARWRRAGYFVSTWTVDEPAALQACGRMGLDAVITNDPARALAALAS